MRSLARVSLEPLEHWWQLPRAIWLGQLGRMSLGSPKLREQVSIDGLQSVSLGVSVTDQEATAGRSPNDVFPTAQQRHQHRLCLQDWLHKGFLQQLSDLCCSSQSSKAGRSRNS